MILLSFLATALLPAPAIRNFTFRDWHAGDAHKTEDVRIAFCTPIAAGKACVLQDSRIGGIAARQIGVAFGRNGLFALEAKFPSDKANVVEAALRSRYGAPCEVRTEHPRHLMTAAKLTRLVRVWCFRDGRATFQSMTERRSEASFEFATHDAARQAAVVDF